MEKGFIDSKEENRKEKDQLQQETQNFVSKRLNCWTTNQTLPPENSQKETSFFAIIKTPVIKIINQFDN